jgi:hypothetical protein
MWRGPKGSLTPPPIKNGTSRILRYVPKHGSAEFISKKFQCAICSSEMKFCRGNIYAHMKVGLFAFFFKFFK